MALGHQVRLPDVLGPAEPAGHTPEGLLISAGTGDNMAAALGLGVGPGDAVVTLGASGTVFAVHDTALSDPSGTITAFADATGRHLPVVQVRNAVRVLRGTAELLGTDLAGLSDLAMRSTPGSYGLVLLPYLEGERMPSLPHTAGTLAGLRRESMKPEHLARAAFEGMLCGLADALDVLRGRGVQVRRVFLLGSAGELPGGAGDGGGALRGAGGGAGPGGLRGARGGPAGGLGAGRPGGVGLPAGAAALGVGGAVRQPGHRARGGPAGRAGGAAAVRGGARPDPSGCPADGLTAAGQSR